MNMQAERNAKSSPMYERLDTAFVNLGALLRYLQERRFVGRIHVVLEEYEASVLLDGGVGQRVREIDHATGRKSDGEDALTRLLVRAREPGGLITVYEGADEAAEREADADRTEAAEADDDGQALTSEEMEWRECLRISGEIIAAVERATLSAQADFAGIFRAVRLELADDFPFLDPSTRRFEYAHATVRLHAGTAVKVFVAGLSECLRRTVERVAKGAHAKRLRERVALELAILARRRQTQLARFKWTQQFDRIAGTRVL
ncbi:MAG: hypothetical protein ICV68_05780 [Pyrinomonadaceae bacterium]|nr:hypothetical protein [Pyrinomonadaceae bacterium]